MTLTQLKARQKATIKSLPTNTELKVKLIEQGFSLSSEIAFAHQAPFNGPMAFYLHGTKMCLPKSIAEEIGVELV